MTCLAIAVLGVLFSAGEYGTGSIRSTMTSTPRRLPVLWAKIVVIGLSTFAVGFGLLIASIAISAGMHAAHGWDYVSIDPLVLGAACGAAGDLAFTAIFALAIGFIVRSVAAGISIVVGILFVIPILVETFIGSLKWLIDIAVYQFPESGRFMRSISVGAPVPHTLEPWQGTLVVAAWVTVATVIAIVLVKNKDA